MKFYVILLFFISQNILGQNIPSKITFKDGVTFEGFAEITKKGGILFSLERNTTGDIYGADELSRIEFIEYSGNRVFEYVRVLNRKREKFLLMEIIESGKISLFHHYEVKKRFDPNSNYLFPDNTNNGLLTFPIIFPKILEENGRKYM